MKRFAQAEADKACVFRRNQHEGSVGENAPYNRIANSFPICGNPHSVPAIAAKDPSRIQRAELGMAMDLQVPIRKSKSPASPCPGQRSRPRLPVTMKNQTSRDCEF
jgi:hypothetical protein